MLLRPDGKLTEMFEDEDPDDQFKQRMLRRFLLSERRCRWGCTSTTKHRCYKREKEDDTCDVSTCLFGCFQSQQPSHNNRDLSRVANRMVHGRICTCVPSLGNFVRDVNHVRIYTDYAILRRIHHHITDHEDCPAHPHGKSSFA